MKAAIQICLAALFLWGVVGAGEWGHTRRGIKNFRQGDYEEAEKCFQKAKKSAPDDPVTSYNLGTALYKREQYGESAKEFGAALAADTARSDTALIADALYNIGNCAYRADSLQQAARFYKSSLLLNPDDEDAKFNLELTLRHLQEQQSRPQCQQKQQQRQKQQNQQQQNQQQNQGQNQQQNEQQNQQEQNRQQEQQDQQQQPQEQQRKQQQAGMSKEEAERLMEAMERQEQELLQNWFKEQKAQRRPGGRYRNQRDW